MPIESFVAHFSVLLMIRQTLLICANVVSKNVHSMVLELAYYHGYCIVCMG